MSTASVDSITYSVVTNALGEACAESFDTLLRTARSHGINIARDCSVALTDGDTDLVVGNEGVPVHLGSIGMTTGALADGVGAVRPGDVLLTNDPYAGINTHTADFTVARPVFADGTPLAWVVVKAHQADIGAVDPVAMPTSSAEIYDEGLRIPPIRLVEEGDLRDDLVELIAANSRFEDVQRGDLLAMVGAADTGVQRVDSLVDRHGGPAVRESMERFQATTEERIREAVRDLPDGTYRGESRSDATPNDDRSVTVAVEITVDGEDVTFDFSDSDAELAAPTNNSLATTYTAVHCTWFSAFDVDVPLNAGSFAMVDVVAPEGLVVNPEPPTATAYATVDFAQETMEACWKALAEIDPKRAPAGWSRWVRCYVTGHDPVEDEDYMDSTTITMGGAGATWGQDGANLVGGPILLGGLLPPDPEVTEHLEPLRIDRLEIRADSAGAGRWRGGLGLDVEFTAVGHEALFSLGGDFGQESPPWGLLGGGEGDVVRVFTRADGETTEIDRSWQNLTLGDGETYRQESGGGGGVGDPHERDPAAVGRDVRDGYVSRDAAREEYGVVFEDDSLAVDHERTAALRGGEE